MGSCIASGECIEDDTTNISTDAVSQWLYTSTDNVIIPIIMPIICCLAFITNFTFFFVIVRVPNMRSDTNIYLVSMAFADLLYVSLSSGLYLWMFTASPVVFHFQFVNSAGCVSFILALNIGYFASVALVTMVTYERYLAVCYPIQHRNIRGRQRTYKLVAVCWLVGLMFAGSTVPLSAVLKAQRLQWPDNDKYQGYPSLTAKCDVINPWVQLVIPLLQNIPWLIAMVVNIYMYFHIVQVLHNRRTDRNHTHVRIQNKVAKMLIVNGVMFFICQVPYRVLSFSEWICILAGIPDPLLAGLGNNARWISTLPQLVNTIINPLIYGMMNGQYWAAFMQAFRCKRPLRKRDNLNRPFTITAIQNQMSNIDTMAVGSTNETHM